MRARWVPLAILAVLCFASGILISRKLAGLLGAGAGPAVVHVDSKALEKERVDPTPGLLERIQLGRVQPAQVRIGLEPSGAGKKRVADYCMPAGQLVQTSARPDPVPDSATKRGTSPRILPDFNGQVRGSKVALHSTLSDGTPWSADYKVHGHWTFVSTDSGVDVRSERFWSRLARGVLRCGRMAGAGAGVGYLVQSQQPLQGAARGAAIAGSICGVNLVF
jgi:hypothetical protein